MANGFDGSRAQWERLEFPLRALDADLQAFADHHKIALSSNSRNWPDRAMTWGDTVHRLIQVYLVDHEHASFTFLLCAWEDRGRERYLRKEFLKEAVPIEEIAGDLPELLERGRLLLESWTSDTLEFATKLGPVP
jgi:hypothetical protein